MIYFMQPVDGGPVKIGFTQDVEGRHRQLEAHYRCELVILATREGGRKEERELHARFAHLRFGRTEQFRLEGDLSEFLQQPPSPHGRSDPMSPGKRDMLVRVPGALHQRIQEAADQEGNSVAAFIRAAVVKELKRREKEGV